MEAVEILIRKRRRLALDAQIAGIDNFVIEEGRGVDGYELFARHGSMLSPFCLDHARRRMLFSMTPPEVDLQSSGPFFYREQRRYTQRLYALDYGEIPGLVASLTHDPQPCIFIHSTGRCGSTLLTRLLATASTVQSLSEPDIYTHIALLNSHGSGASTQELRDLLGYSTRLLVQNLQMRRPQNPIVVVKLRGVCVYIAELLCEAVPASTPVFLYRNALAVIGSYARAYFGSPLIRLLRTLGLDAWFFSLQKWQALIESFVPLVRDPRFDRHPDLTALLTLLWLSSMDAALRVQERPTPLFACALRYETLVQEGSAYVDRLLQRCGYEIDIQPHADRVFALDAEKGARVFRGRDPDLTSDEQQRIRSLISLHGRIADPGFILPGTLR